MDTEEFTVNELRESLGYPRKPADKGGNEIARVKLLPGATAPSVDQPSIESPELPEGGVGKVQDTALNGAQVTALQGIVADVTAGLLQPKSAVALIKKAFPTISEQEAWDMMPDSSFRPTNPTEQEKPLAEIKEGENRLPFPKNIHASTIPSNPSNAESLEIFSTWMTQLKRQ